MWRGDEGRSGAGGASRSGESHGAVEGGHLEGRGFVCGALLHIKCDSHPN